MAKKELLGVAAATHRNPYGRRGVCRKLHSESEDEAAVPERTSDGTMDDAIEEPAQTMGTTWVRDGLD
eukprot:CAMPEP_0194049770 /NCGR_PEP_ID=MMETSP0009_2-20130614/30883_1 /TAXON_ID=210454 /ORGANISM="Grammatophora oceanica, Strain CCMP 410" /LENGTH=67 /DNA_ID=CAMNT_0038695991 /DNA_START=1017 /DNA_END=1220 /DNA_ORIENTATION=+